MSEDGVQLQIKGSKFKPLHGRACVDHEFSDGAMTSLFINLAPDDAHFANVAIGSLFTVAGEHLVTG